MKHIYVDHTVPLTYLGVNGRRMPCRFVRKFDEEGRIIVRITRTVNGYQKGEVIKVFCHYLVPSVLIGIRNGKYVIKPGTYEFKEATS